MSEISNTESKEMSSQEHVPISKIQTTGDANEFIIIGGLKYHKHELMEAFGGTLNPGYSLYPARQFGNPSPLGLCGFAMTTLLLSLVNAGAMGITVSSGVLGLACFFGGFAQFVAGIWEGFVGNTFALCALTSYGAFWLSFAAINIEAFGIAAAYESEAEFVNAVSFFLLGWTLFTAMLTLCTLKSTWLFFSLFFCLTITFALLTAGDFTGVTNATRAGGVFGIITAFIAFANAFAGVATKQNSYLTVRAIKLPWVR